VISWGPQDVEARIIDAHPRRFADPQDDSIFHPRTLLLRIEVLDIPTARAVCPNV
jgi:hypothetical protein